MQYPYGNFSFDKGKIIGINNNTIEHNVPNENGSLGSPLIKRYNMNFIVGIHFGALEKESEELNRKEGESNIVYKCNLETPFDIIIEDMINKLSKNVEHSKSVEYRNIINLIINKTDTEEDEDYDEEWNNPKIIFGKKFVENNKDNITLIINGKKSVLIDKYELKKGSNNIQMIINKKLTNLEYMFYHSVSLENIEELKYLNTENGNNFESMFYGCTSLSDIKQLQNWNISNENNFSLMLYNCKSLSDIKALQNWNVSNGNNFQGMFYSCESLSDIKPL